MGIVHGGAYAAFAESLASVATFKAVQPESIAMGQSNDTSFLRPVSEGRVNGEVVAATAAARAGSGRSTSPTTRAVCARLLG